MSRSRAASAFEMSRMSVTTRLSPRVPRLSGGSVTATQIDLLEILEVFAEEGDGRSAAGRFWDELEADEESARAVGVRNSTDWTRPTGSCGGSRTSTRLGSHGLSSPAG
jgi:hypothetical protein